MCSEACVHVVQVADEETARRKRAADARLAIAREKDRRREEIYAINAVLRM